MYSMVQTKPFPHSLRIVKVANYYLRKVIEQIVVLITCPKSIRLFFLALAHTHIHKIR